MRRRARPTLPDRCSSSSVPLRAGTSGNENADVAQIGSGRRNLQKLAMRIKVAVAVMRSKRPRGGSGVKRVIAAKDGTRRVRRPVAAVRAADQPSPARPALKH